MADNDQQVKKPAIDSYPSLVTKSEAFINFHAELVTTVNISTTGITNLVVDYEDPFLVKTFLRSCYNSSKLYNETVDVDAVELQQGAPGRGNASNFLDEMIYGTYKMLPPDPSGLGGPQFDIDKATGARKRNADGFLSRAAALNGTCKDKVLVIKNIDHSLDFCPNTPGCVQNSLWIFDNFRNPIVRKTMKLLLVSNIPLKFPFKIRRIHLPKVNDYEANHVIDSVLQLYQIKGYNIGFSDNQRTHICRKLTGLTYSESTDVIMAAISNSCDEVPDSAGVVQKIIDGKKVVKLLREKINSMLMEDSFGLTHLTPRPWEDYICAESSSFTYDVKKILRDFNEIKRLTKIRDTLEKVHKDASATSKTIEAIQIRMPHVMVLYGSGGVGKCLGKGTKVLMFNGDIKNVEDVKVGDKLMGPDSMPRNVLRTTSGIGHLYRVEQKNGDDYVCNDKHILSLQKTPSPSDKTTDFISAEDFVKKDKNWRKYHNGWKTGVEFSEQSLPIDPYWLGLWLGDGTARKPQITVGDMDVETTKWLENWAKENGLFISKTHQNGASALYFSCRIGSGVCKTGANHVRNGLKKLKLLKKNIASDNFVSGEKHIPEIYLKNSSQNRLLLMAGLIDSDGYMTKTGSIQFTNTNKRLAQDYLYLVRSLGFKAFWSEAIKGIKSRNYKVRAYTVTIGGALSRIPTKLPRKQGHDNPQKRSLRCTINVVPIGEGEYFGFEIDGDKQFLLGDFTVTHNSAMPIHLAGLLEFDVWDFNINATHSKWIGEGSERMRETLKKIAQATHIVVRVDEYDRGMGSTGEDGSGMHEAHKQVEAEFMNWLQNCQEDNLFVKNNIFIVMTTNHKENITGPMLRSGRSDLVIGIDNFDTKSMIEAFDSASRRMSHRGVKVVGFDGVNDLQNAINKLDKPRLAEIAMTKGFTVRDIDILVIEMAAHAYYKKVNGEGLEWNTENFVKVLERSQGSTRDNTTGELVIGDRFIYGKEDDKVVIDDKQQYFSFFDKDPSNLNQLKIFDQK